ncbi:hypothetical protein C8J56DRAFT_769797 [Mycena floridula]|nr:hypothetical protein C8J56DRAFT_769797 [Mycena floridula]
MSTVANGVAGPSSPTDSLSDQTKTLRELRLSVDGGERGSSPAPVAANGHAKLNGEDDESFVNRLQKELDKTRDEKEHLATQYRNLLAKLTAMRSTLGNKLKQDAEELDRREQLVQQLSVQNDDLSSTVETLRAELIASHEDNERASGELDSLRTRAFQENAQESLMRERELRETQTELERCRMERDEWERLAMEEKAMSDESKSSLEVLTRDLELEREAREREAVLLDAEKERADNLQSVLQDFQAAKEHELRQAVSDYDQQLHQATQSLAEYKHRALTAELKLEESQTDTTRTQELEKEVKEKNLLINKLRHEAVIMNEHLMEALRRLRRNSTDTNVDRRLVTNVLLSFLTTPRADAKRFEMLSLLATILAWSDPEREKAGLQRAQPNVLSPSASFWTRSPAGSPAAKSPELQKTDETESFSRLWVEFLLTEAQSGGATTTNSPPPRNNSLPSSPGPANSPPRGTRRLPSLSSAAMASSPSLTPSQKGKEKETNSVSQ